MKPSEREKLQDCLLLLQSAHSILCGMRQFGPDLSSIEKCCHDAGKTLARLLRG
jgi:hypothetical protein